MIPLLHRLRRWQGRWPSRGTRLFRSAPGRKRRAGPITFTENLLALLRRYQPAQALTYVKTYGLRTFFRRLWDRLIQAELAAPLEADGRDPRTPTPALAPRAEPYFDYLFTTINSRDQECEPFSPPLLAPTDIKLIAFYLPQFHPIRENDEWWGKGFTEWTNVTRAVPQFIGHYQPRLPGELGFYDLRVPEVQKRQIELARLYGIYGFCFHFYWFLGKTLLATPLDRFLSDPDVDFPFCVNWANENWTRRWDGRDDEVLIRQTHSSEADIDFIRDVSKYLRDRRYIRIDSRPLLLVYRPALLPDPKATARRWREWCAANGIGDIYLALCHSFEHLDPREVGFDAAIEFAPNTFPLRPIKDRIPLTNANFTGQIFDYRDAIRIASDYRKPAYVKFRGVCPGWDNDPRKPGRGNILAHSSPSAYREWLTIACDYTVTNFPADRRFVFINAWNEWAEGAYLEPDRRYGYAYLRATADVLAGRSTASTRPPGAWRILFVTHDADVGGSQTSLLNILTWFTQHTFVDLKTLCLEGGAWLRRFEEIADTLVLSDLEGRLTSEEGRFRALREFCGGSPDVIYVNSVAAGRVHRLLCRFDAPIITHFRELPASIERYAAGWIDEVLRSSAHFVACSGAVKETLVQTFGVDPARVNRVHSTIRPDGAVRILSDPEKRALRRRLGLEKHGCLIFGCGLGMAYRKGADLFIEVARALRNRAAGPFHFYWVGEFDPRERDERYGLWADHLGAMRSNGTHRYVTFLGLKANPRAYFQAGDIFLQTSREEPLGLGALEAAECGLPIICFADSGGSPEFLEADAGLIVPRVDSEAMADTLASLIQDHGLRRQLGDRAREKVLSRFTLEQTGPHILSTTRKIARKTPACSVIVPNYNHARYLRRRLDSIFDQTFMDFEVILLDDASTDESLAVLEQYRDRSDVRIVTNDRNTGSPFSQWLKGIEMARADLIWIAESDDASEPQFLETLVRVFRDPDVKLAYTASHILDEHDRVTGDYVSNEYLTSLSPSKWQETYRVSATEEINEGLGIKNTILNMSAVLFRKFEFDEDFRNRLAGMRISGDWYFIVHAIRNGKVHYEAKKLNYHRRHAESVIGKAIRARHIEGFLQARQAVDEFVVANYELWPGFVEKWEQYLRKLWRDFCPGRPFSELKEYYPFDEMRQRITTAESAYASKSPPVAPLVGRRVPAPEASPEASSPREAPAFNRAGSGQNPGIRSSGTLARRATGAKLLFISHDASRTGAPRVLLHFLRWFKANSDMPFQILLRQGGDLAPEFSDLAPVVLWDANRVQVVRRALGQVGLVYSNTITNGEILARLEDFGRPVISHVHELEYWMRSSMTRNHLEQALGYTDHYIAVSRAVKECLVRSFGIPAEKIDLVYECIVAGESGGSDRRATEIRRRLGIPDEALVVGGSGTRDWRKGPDLFIQLAQSVGRRDAGMPVHFLWVGGSDQAPYTAALLHDLQRARLDSHVHFVAKCANPADYFAAFDVFASTSREDPFPLVVLEAANMNKPILCFEDAGGASEFVQDDAGFVVPYLDIDGMADRVVELLRSPELRQRLGERGAEKARKEHDVTVIAPQIMRIIERYLDRGAARPGGRLASGGSGAAGQGACLTE